MRIINDAVCGAEVDLLFPKRPGGQPPAWIITEGTTNCWQSWVMDTDDTPVLDYHDPLIEPDDPSLPSPVRALFQLQAAGYVDSWMIFEKTVGGPGFRGSYATCLSWIPSLEAFNIIRQVADAPSWHGSVIAQFPAWAKVAGKVARPWDL